MPRQSGKLMRQRIEQAIADLTALNGRPPTNREIGTAVGVSSTGHIEYHLRCMREEGIISHEPRKSRGITLLRQAEAVVPMATSVRVRLVGQIAAGTAIEANEQVDEYIDLTEGFPTGADIFALRVKGTSMIDDHIDNGDIVLVRRQSYADNGDTVVALLNSNTSERGEATLKRFYREKGGVIRLQPRNSELQPILVDADKLDIQGKVVAVLRQI
ncbi:MAG TPA: transcriptional repressor LexA [Chloroflexota bacterium]|nr:transcriptional repressor LexA [Chloroflexota bacterium]